jgi:hypothetical protein
VSQLQKSIAQVIKGGSIQQERFVDSKAIRYGQALVKGPKQRSRMHTKFHVLSQSPSAKNTLAPNLQATSPPSRTDLKYTQCLQQNFGLSGMVSDRRFSNMVGQGGGNTLIYTRPDNFNPQSKSLAAKEAIKQEQNRQMVERAVREKESLQLSHHPDYF